MPKAREASVSTPVTRMRLPSSSAIWSAYLPTSFFEDDDGDSRHSGGTGPAGRGLAVRFAGAGHEVVLGSRDADRAKGIARGLTLRGEGTVVGGTNEDAAACELVVVATPWDSAIATTSALRQLLRGKVVISMANALSREGRELLALYPPRGSMAAQIAFALPESVIVGAFHHLPAAQMEELDPPLDADVLVFSDDDDARRRSPR